MSSQTLDGETLPWEEVKRRLLSLKDGQSLSIDAPDDAFLIVHSFVGYGYLVTGLGIGEREYFTLIEKSLGDEPISAFDGGDTRVFVRHSLVSAAVMMAAVEAYYRSGQRDHSYEWVHDEDSVYE